MSDSVSIPAGYEMQSGTGAPAASLGMDTDRYLDYATGDFYEKNNGSWAKMASFGPASVPGRLVQLATATVGESALVTLSLGVKRYTVTATGAATTDRLYVALTGAPSNGTLQDAYVSAANTVSVGLLVPALGVASTVAVPIAIYKVT